MPPLHEIASHPKVRVKVFTPCENRVSKIKGDAPWRLALSLSPKFVLDCPEESTRESLLPWLQAYAKGQWSLFPLPLYKTPFAQKAALCLQSTSPGQLLSYQEVAAAIGHAGAARAVGTFCSGNLFPLLIPCHRVIPSGGSLGFFTPDPQIKRELLQFEGITF